MDSAPRPTQAAAYLEAISALNVTTGAGAAERGLSVPAGPEDLSERARVVVERSDELGRSIATRLGDDTEPSERELASLQLLAAAAIDLAVASDLATAAADGAAAGVERAATPGILTELRPILEAPAGVGLEGVTGAGMGVERRPRSSGPEEARRLLREDAEATLQCIRDDASAAGRAALVGLLQVPSPPLKEAANVAAHELLKAVGDSSSALIRKAVALVAQALDKILAALGPQLRERVRAQAADWVEGLKQADAFGSLLDRVYEFGRLKEEVVGRVDVAPAGVDVVRLDEAAKQLEALGARFHQQTNVLSQVVKGLAWGRPWILGLAPPWGPLSLTTAYVALIGYTVYAGGDYLDWYRTGDSGRMDFVVGVRSVVQRAMEV
ncbi:hypothetical protein V5E97_11395 [Singulisphaera sp. Ch08]|uniref:Uncharacterized protein n=1 Tax=Singulisphaera sp. Ch08 TaxID=3120278 RepID=A0AAU7CNM7_9BACT